MKLFIVSYEHDHKQLSAYIHATSWADAESRLGALKATGAVFGEHVQTIEAAPGVVDNITKAINKGRN